MRVICVCFAVIVAAGCGGGRVVSNSVAGPHAANPRIVSNVGRAAAEDTLRIPLPPGWQRRVGAAGLTVRPLGLTALILANFRLPTSASECEGRLPLRRGRVVIRVYDHGPGSIGQSWPASAVLSVGAVHSVVDPISRHRRGYSQSRIRFHGRSIMIQVIFGRPKPAAVVRRQVRAVLATTSRAIGTITE